MTPRCAVQAPPAVPTALPLLAAGVTMVLWASAFVVIRAVGDSFAPGSLALGRLLVGALVLTAIVLTRPIRIPRGRTLALVTAYGALWFGVYTVVVNATAQYLDAGTTALLVNVAPLLIAVLAGLFLGEGFPRALVLGLLIAFAGIVAITAATSTGAYDLAGVALGLLAAVLYAVGVLLQKRALPGTDAMTATWLGCVVGAVACLPFLPGLIEQTLSAPRSATLGVVYLGVFPTALAFSTWAYALTHTSAGRLSASSYLVPAIAVFLSWLFLTETPAALALLGGVLCLVGVGVTRLPSRTPSPRNPRGRRRSHQDPPLT